MNVIGLTKLLSNLDINPQQLSSAAEMVVDITLKAGTQIGPIINNNPALAALNWGAFGLASVVKGQLSDQPSIWGNAVRHKVSPMFTRFLA